MNTDVVSARALAAEIASETRRREHIERLETAVCPPFVNLSAVRDTIQGTSIRLGAQNMSEHPSGAYTGETSSSMLVSAGCDLVILGHSERRQYFGETDASVSAKGRAAQETGLQPIVCVGERLDEREQGREEEVVARQIRGSLEGVNGSGGMAPVIAYEPVWAIGTGHTATPEQAQTMHRFICTLLADMWGEQSASQTRILYGGSMKPDNAGELLNQADIDGGLIGGASLKASSFLAVIDSGLEVA